MAPSQGGGNFLPPLGQNVMNPQDMMMQGNNNNNPGGIYAW